MTAKAYPKVLSTATTADPPEDIYSAIKLAGKRTSAWRDDYDKREAYIKEIGYVKVTPKLVRAILPYCPLLEIGAGTGALAAAIAEAGGDIEATDNYTWDKGAQASYSNWVGKHFDVRKIGAAAAVGTIRPDQNLLCAWPAYAKEWCTKAVAKLPVGRDFVFIGEGQGGCTGSDSLFALLERDFVKVKDAAVDQWMGMHDYLEVYHRVRKGEANVEDNEADAGAA